MPTYSSQFKREIVKKVLTHKDRSIDQIAREHEISRASLFKWVKDHGSEVVGVHPKAGKPFNWTYAAKLQTLLETQHMNELDLGRYLRRDSLYYSNLLEWKEEILKDGLKSKNHKIEQDQELLIKRIRDLERELKIKDKALREATSLIELKKKAQDLWPEPEEENSHLLKEKPLRRSSKKRKKADVD